MDRKSFLLRLDPATMDALRVWAGDDLRSLNGQMEYLLRRALRDAGRHPEAKGPRPGQSDSTEQTNANSSTRERAAIAPEDR
ncbi:MAG: hypothetical protein ABSA21_10355 [Candidatus Limnocylindrales bacterium]|jgi:hypothetical protein